MAELAKPRILCVGTHHKTGTMWMRSLFRVICKKLNIPIVLNRKLERIEDLPEKGRVYIFCPHTNFSNKLLERGDVRVLHIIRDPRDVLISGAKYHEFIPPPKEKWLRVSRDDLGGLTYQEHLKSLPDNIAKLLFEMENAHQETLNRMLAWNYQRKNVTDLHYEDLIQDESCALFERILRDFGFNDDEVKIGLNVFWNKSLFGGLKKKVNRTDHMNAHISSGAVAQWKTKLPLSVLKIYFEKYGDDLIELGYEKDKNWLQHVDNAA